jgi:hypothetical protein
MSMEGTRQGSRTRWQEYIISKADFLENERARLCARECERRETTSYVTEATSRHLKNARRAAGLTEKGDADHRVARRHRLVNTWTGASVEGAFVNLHAAEVVLANLYSEQDINSRVPDILARMRSCLPTAPPPPRHPGGVGATDPATAATRHRGRPTRTVAARTRSPNCEPGCATPCGSPTTRPMTCTPGLAASATC